MGRKQKVEKKLVGVLGVIFRSQCQSESLERADACRQVELHRKEEKR